ncbi:hypothetical protein BAnh1_03690 [Bartonella australis AUST/NH1]|uniref:Thiol:disulfide interchange protein DsbD N-terminal domain-containing protein n=1 Tax=Bartonella australis (strain Aust/NH1) TaxID=1094489 RepID=M1PCA6_BARAA|nr:protein-disulfide reductase DsbD domain-containing protein [Bartonella australis]AGF74251.1 hypothetical protein BAnh1_03690 [Bartonella australis AUST/NH1]
MKKLQIFTMSQRTSNIFYKNLLISLSLIIAFLGQSNFAICAQPEQEANLFATPWYKSDGNRVRLAVTKPSLSGTRDGVIEIILQPGWKTYWRNPGNSGMAPFFNFDQQVSYEIFYPAPQLYEAGNDWSLGYKNHVVLPFNISNSEENLSGSLTLGICNKICIPFTVNFNFSPFTKENKRLPLSLLANARAALPRTMHNEFKISSEKNKDTLLIKIQHNSDNIPLALFLDGGEIQIGPAKKINDQEGYTLFSAPIYFAPKKTDRTVFYIVSSKDHAFSGTFVIHAEPSHPTLL